MGSTGHVVSFGCWSETFVSYPGTLVRLGVETRCMCAYIQILLTCGLQVLLPLAGLFDVAKELGRLNKQRTKIEKELSGITAKLNNPAFIEKVGFQCSSFRGWLCG